MTDEIKKLFDANEKHPPIGMFHRYVLGELRNRVKASRGRMAQYYGEWDRNVQAYSSRRAVDKDDAEALKVGLPTKVALPLSYAQINVFVAFLYALYTQRERFYEYTAIETDDHKLRECCELVVHQNMLRMRGKEKLFQNLLNVARFGIGIEIDYWAPESVWVPVKTEQPAPTIGGLPTGESSVTTAITKLTRFEGSRIETVSPYRFFPDPSVDLHNWRDGEFVAWETEWTRAALKAMEAEGVVFGIDHVDALGHESRVNRRMRADASAYGSSGNVIVTQVVWYVVPAAVQNEGKALSSDEHRQRWLFWVANDSRIIRAEPLPNLHCDWPVSTAMFAPDMHDELITSLATVSRDLQGLIAWLLNSRMAAVSRTIDSRFIVDPTAVSLDDLVNNYRIIRMSKSGVNRDIRRVVQQVQVADTTTGHVGDMSTLTSLMQMVTGVNDNVTGQYHSGRRSAAESRVVTNAAASRLKLVGDLIWASHYQPQANRLLTNLREAMSEEMFVRICGNESKEYFPAFRSTPENLAASFDYVAFDGTLPSDKQFMAQQLMEVFSLLVSNMQSSAAFNMDPAAVLKESLRLRGLGSGQQFAFTQVPKALLTMIAQENGAGQPANPNVI